MTVLLYSVVLFYRDTCFLLLLIKIICYQSFSNGGRESKINCTFNICYEPFRKDIFNY
jgi:hypothetical protein